MQESKTTNYRSWTKWHVLWRIVLHFLWAVDVFSTLPLPDLRKLQPGGLGPDDLLQDHPERHPHCVKNDANTLGGFQHPWLQCDFYLPKPCRLFDWLDERSGLIRVIQVGRDGEMFTNVRNRWCSSLWWCFWLFYIMLYACVAASS